MAQQVFGPSAVVSVLNRAFTNTSPSNAVFNNQLAAAGVTDASQLAFARSFGATYAVGQTSAQLSATVMMNLGLDNAALSTALTDYINANGKANIGIIAYQLANILSGLENDVTYGTAAKAWNAEVTSAYEYSSNVKNTTASSGSTTGNEAGSSTVLTTGQDIVTGGAGNDNFRGVAGQPVGNQEQSTFNSSDIIDGGAGQQDVLILNLVGNYGGGARVKNIETLQLGTNVTPAGGVNFDYNVNAGFNEISDVTKVVADQINATEQLNVVNVVRTVAGDAKVLPTLSWENDSNTAAAGTVSYGYRAAEITGTTDAQNIQLKSVNNGDLRIGAGIETFNLKSMGTERVTLANRDAGVTTIDTGVNNVAADLASSGALTKVIITTETATAEVGKAAGIIATGDDQGLTDRTGAGANDLGRALGAAASASNLLSVGSRVTEVDASAATANVNVRFTIKSDNTATDVTFKGGEGNDYVEFQLGKVAATGGKGADTFAFLNNTFLNSSFGSTDSIQGGEGSDTIQLGLNGAGNYNINTTEFNNKTGIEVLDVRANTSAIGLQDAFVAGADVGTFTVRYDRVNQTSATDSANAVGATNLAAVTLENNTTNTLDLTSLALNRAINVLGGSGSERLIVSDASFNASFAADLGTNLAANNASAISSDFDTITILNTAVVDSGDLANVKGVEGFVLAKSGAVANSFTIELTETFLLNNTAAANSVATTGDDSVFNIVTTGINSLGGATSGGVQLGAGDTVTIDISNLLTAGGALKASLAGRGLDVADLVADGVTVNYVVNGNSVAAGSAAVTAVTKADADGIIATQNSAAGKAVVNADVLAGATYTTTNAAETVQLFGGAQTIAFTTAVAPDTFLGYSVPDDSITLSKTAFAGLGALGALTAGEFESGAGLTAAGTATGRIVYNTTNGNLYYDADGNAAGGLAAVLIGTFSGAPALVAGVGGEFTIVA